MQITVLMPVYNNERNIKHAIISILYQTYTEYEFLIINDGSTDNTSDIIKRISDPRIKYIYKEHSGLSDTLNYGLQIAKNCIVARMDSDDIAHPQRLQLQVDKISNNNIDIISSWYAVFSNNKIKYIVKTHENHNDILQALKLHSHIVHSGLIYNKNLIIENGGYSDTLFEDYELWLRILNRVRFYNIPKVLTYVRKHNKNISNRIYSSSKNIVYSIQSDYYNNNLKMFGNYKDFELIVFNAWREYFYGNKIMARKYFAKVVVKSLDYRILLAWITTFFREKYFYAFKGLRLRYRILYFTKYFSKENINLRNELNNFSNTNHFKSISR